jgi:hypothetical protein
MYTNSLKLNQMILIKILLPKFLVMFVCSRVINENKPSLYLSNDKKSRIVNKNILP